MTSSAAVPDVADAVGTPDVEESLCKGEGGGKNGEMRSVVGKRSYRKTDRFDCPKRRPN